MPEQPKYRPQIREIKTLQHVENTFRTMLGLDDTPVGLFKKLQGEVTEAGDAVVSGDRKAIAGELADVIIFTMSLASMHGISIQEAISGKIARNFDKYAPFRMQQLLQEGLSSEDAMAKMKSEWDKTADDNYLQGV